MPAWRQFWPFRGRAARADAERLVGVVNQVSRQRGFFGEGRVPDTLAGRLDVMFLIASLVFIRLRAERRLEPLAQNFADCLFRHFDAGLREAGVGDLAVPKRMGVIAGDFYGRLGVYAEALAARDDAALEAALARNMLGVAPDAAFAGALRAYAVAAFDRQAAAPAEVLFRLDGWGSAPL